MKLALAALAVGLVAALVGWVWLGEVGELKLRTERSVATYEDGMLIYTTLAGTEASIPVWDECKNLGPRPANECIAYYENGDEVVITYDSAEPTNAWRGPTPNGVPATGLFWGGIAAGDIRAVRDLVHVVMVPAHQPAHHRRGGRPPRGGLVQHLRGLLLDLREEQRLHHDRDDARRVDHLPDVYVIELLQE